MKAKLLFSWILFEFLGLGDSFAPILLSPITRRTERTELFASIEKVDQNDSATLSLSRRSFFKSSVSALAISANFLIPSDAKAAVTQKVLVLGGTGLVGSRVVSQLNNMGYETIVTSTNGRDGTIALNFISDDVKDSVQKLASGCSAVISCVGAIGTENDQTVNSGTSLAALGAKAAGVDRFVYITVSPEVQDMSSNISFLQDYMSGKKLSRSTVLSTYNSGATLIEPTFIYGGDEFKLNPPRVAGFYGSFIEGLLSSGPIRAVEGVMPDGFIKVALEPPLSAESIAKAAIAGALGKSNVVILDNYDKIKAAAAML